MKRKFLTLFAAIVAVSFGSAIADDSCTPIVSKAKITFTYFSAPEGCISGKFKVSTSGETDKFVYFSEGNLQYQMYEQNNYKWRLAEHQYILSPSAPNYSSAQTPKLTVSGTWYDLIQPGATANEGEHPYMAFNNGTVPSSFTYGYDWGYFCDITNYAETKTFPKQTFRLLSETEWENVFANHDFFMADVEVLSGTNCYALLIIPYGITKYHHLSSTQTKATIDNATWTQMVKEGVLLLPAVGYSQYIAYSSYNALIHTSNVGVYLGSTSKNSSNKIRQINFGHSVDAGEFSFRVNNAADCVAIRLVRDEPK